MRKKPYRIVPEKWHGDDVGNLPCDEGEAEVWAVYEIDEENLQNFLDAFNSRLEAQMFIVSDLHGEIEKEGK